MKIISIDFDGVIHAYTSPFTTATEIHDGPVPGALDFIRTALDRGFGVHIHTARANNPHVEDAIVAWLLTHGLEHYHVDALSISARKKGAVVYIDDRGWRFEGRFPTFDEIGALRQWNRLPTSVRPEIAAALRRYEGEWARSTRGQDLAEASIECRDRRQAAILDWTQRTFGHATTAIAERINRFIEESVELAQAEGMPIDVLRSIVDHVYAKKPGDPFQEAGSVGVTLLAYCSAKGISAEAAEVAETHRVFAIDPEYFRKRHNAKADAGIAVRAAVEEPEVSP